MSDETQRDLTAVLRAFVDGVLRGCREMPEVDDPDAEMVAALIDISIGICLARGVPRSLIVAAFVEHVDALGGDDDRKRKAN